MDQITKRDRAIRAESLLNDEILAEALTAIERTAVEALATADVSDHAALQCAAADLQAVRRFRSDLQGRITGQSLADREPIATA